MNASSFDPATAYLAAGFLYVIMPLAAWVVMGKSRTLAAGIWCGGSLSLGLASLLLSFRTPDMPGWVAFGVMNAFFYGGNLMHVVGLRMELGKRSTWPIALLVGVGMLGIQEFFRLGLESVVLRLSWVLLAMGTLFAWTAWLAWQVHKKESSSSARWLTQVYVFGALATLVRAARVLLGMSSTDPLGVNWDSVLTTSSLFVMSVFGSVAILGLYLERSTRRYVANEVAMRSQQTSQLLGQQIANLDRQRSMGELAGAMAHEMAQPLTVVTVELGLLRHEMRAVDDSRQSQVEQILAHIERVSNVLKGIRNFIRPAEPDFKPVNLLVVVQDVLQLLPAHERQDAADIQVRTDVLSPMVMGDSVQLSQVLLNVLRNAVQAQVPGKPVHIRIHVLAVDERLQVVVEDDGPGFSAQLLGSNDVAFSSTKKDGMGIGLAISRRIAVQHGGTLLWRNRAHGGGAQVVLDLPVWMVSKGKK
ncbi:HAMP domain-containing sensor histidine kinase [Limnohabitans sp.]|uniref:sensor histidine kinase n=1 Tax=Limnohabitans sp. TaxID=1907725 RepID=UPI002AFE3E8C|nr:HAMP domain-containing sensor histidine kinase [Limnohabitans sp.]